jgi:ABC-type multidrug transport system fused ATPase/permease subunit
VCATGAAILTLSNNRAISADEVRLRRTLTSVADFSPIGNVMATRSDSSAPEWHWLWREVRPFWAYQAANLCCIVLYAALLLGPPLLLKWLIDDVLPHRRWGALAIASGLVCAFYAGRILINSTGILINGIGVQRLIFRLRTRLLRHVQGLSPAFYAQHPVGDLMQRLEQDVIVVGELGSVVMPSLIRVVVQTGMTVSAMIFLDWRLACIVVPLMPLFAHVRRRYRSILRQSAEEVREAAGQQSSLLNEMLTGAIQIQLLGAERRLLRRYTRLNLRTMKRQLGQRRNEQLYTILEMCVIAFGTTLIIGYGGTRVFAGALSAGSLVAFYTYVGNIFAPMETAVELYARLHRVRACVRRLIAIDREATDIRDLQDAAPLSLPLRTLVCRDVSFQYTPERKTLRHVNLEVKAGERLAIVGESGSGKSSLLKLIPRLYETEGGRVEINGRDIREVQLRSLRQAISFVPQDPILFQGTIRENLRHGSPTATPDQIEHAAWIACFTGVVERLPKGWDTELGPLGAGLSGGERQRLAIVRALLQSRPVLVLDEATSALDLPTELTLLSRLESWCDGRLVISAGHRLSTARWANRVVVMNSGTVSEYGTHDALQHAGTQYYALWQSDVTSDASEDTLQARM